MRESVHICVHLCVSNDRCMYKFSIAIMGDKIYTNGDFQNLVKEYGRTGDKNQKLKQEKRCHIRLYMMNEKKNGT